MKGCRKAGSYHVLSCNLIVVICLICSHSAKAEVSPREDEIIFQNQLILSVEPVNNAVSYSFKVEGTGFSKETPFASAFIDKLQYGTEYHWSVEIRLRDSTLRTEKHRFFTAPLDRSLSDMRFKIVDHKNSGDSCLPGLILLDFTGVAIDREGRIVWFLDRSQVRLNDQHIRPMLLTESGNILMTSKDCTLECDLKGNTLWHSPDSIRLNGKKLKAQYHHEVQKLSHNSYLTLTKYTETRKIEGVNDSVFIVSDAIVILNDKNQFKWSWSLGDKISGDELKKYYSRERPNGGNHLPLGEINSAYLDEKNKLLYAGIRDISTILVIEYPSGKVLRAYGSELIKAKKNFRNTAFLEQHGGVPDRNGNIWIFNNNGEGHANLNSEAILIQDDPKGDSTVVLFNFNCLIDNLTAGKSQRLGFVSPLSNGNILVCMGYAGRVFELDMNKNILWDCCIETGPSITSANDQPQAKANYRAYFYPGLYPYHFTPQLSSGDKNILIKVLNSGFRDDEFDLYIKSAGGKRVFIGSIKIAAGMYDEFSYDLSALRAVKGRTLK